MNIQLNFKPFDWFIACVTNNFDWHQTRQANKTREREKKNVMTKLTKALLPLNPLITDAIAFIITETVRISKCSKINSLLLKKSKNKYNWEPNFLRKFVVTLLLQQVSIKTDSSFW